MDAHRFNQSHRVGCDAGGAPPICHRRGESVTVGGTVGGVNNVCSMEIHQTTTSAEVVAPMTRQRRGEQVSESGCGRAGAAPW